MRIHGRDSVDRAVMVNQLLPLCCCRGWTAECVAGQPTLHHDRLLIAVGINQDRLWRNGLTGLPECNQCIMLSLCAVAFITDGELDGVILVGELGVGGPVEQIVCAAGDRGELPLVPLMGVSWPCPVKVTEEYVSCYHEFVLPCTNGAP